MPNTRGPNRHPRSDLNLVKNAAGNVFDRLEREKSILLHYGRPNIDELSVSSEAAALVSTCGRCFDAFWHVWDTRQELRREREQREAAQRVAQERLAAVVTTSRVPFKPAPRFMPAVPATYRLTVRMVIPEDLAGKPWVTDLALDCQVGVSLRRFIGNERRHSLTVLVWGIEADLEDQVRDWAKTQGISRIEILSSA